MDCSICALLPNGNDFVEEPRWHNRARPCYLPPITGLYWSHNTAKQAHKPLPLSEYCMPSTTSAASNSYIITLDWRPHIQFALKHYNVCTYLLYSIRLLMLFCNVNRLFLKWWILSCRISHFKWMLHVWCKMEYIILISL